MTHDMRENPTATESLTAAARVRLQAGRPPLPWCCRIRCAAQAGSALAYLHAQDPPVIHRDVKVGLYRNVLSTHAHVLRPRLVRCMCAMPLQHNFWIASA